MSERDEPPSPPELAAAEKAAARASGVSVIWMVLGVFGLAVLGLGFAFLSLGYYSTKRFAGRAREAEGKMALGELSRAIQKCAERDVVADGKSAIRGLPASAPPVPTRLSDVAGKGYDSVLSDWSHPTYECAGFYTHQPQRYQLQWVLVSPTQGTVVARSDADGDGVADDTFELDLTCIVDPGSDWPVCTRSPAIRETHHAR